MMCMAARATETDSSRQVVPLIAQQEQQAPAAGTDSMSQPTDSSHCRHLSKFELALNKITASRAYEMTFAGVPLIAGGLIVKHEDDHFRSLRNDYMKMYNVHYENYLQYVPLAALLGMKIGGVEGRSSWTRLLTSDVFSAAIMASAVNALKYTTKVTRPDGKDNRSFPSGHTATAFMAATMFSKEYGYRSPWYSVGAYGIATATGLMRIATNKHWLSDVMTGAGIGILSTELGYYLTDLIFRDKGLMHNMPADNDFESDKTPSFAGLYMGFNVPVGNYELDRHTSLKTSSGSTSGFEGAHFFNPYVGVGGRFTISDLAFILNDNEAQSETFSFTTLSTGAYFSYPITSRLAIGAKVLGEYTWYQSLNLTLGKVPANSGFGLGTGLSATVRVKPRISYKVVFDYNITPPHGFDSGEYMHSLTLAAVAAVGF